MEAYGYSFNELFLFFLLFRQRRQLSKESHVVGGIGEFRWLFSAASVIDDSAFMVVSKAMFCLNNIEKLAQNALFDYYY